jgi:hypothetical protein
VLDCDAQAVMHQLPSDWRDALRSGGESLARHDTTTAWRSTEAAIDALSAALRAASGSPHAETFAQDLLGPGARAADLARASDGVAQWRGCPWLRVGAWSSLEALQWRPAEESLLVWRAALRHMPLGVWLPGWFSPKWRCDPLRDDAIAVSRAGGQDSQTTLMILIGGQDWSAPAARVGRQWPPLALIDQWRSIEPEFATELCSAERATACQQSIADALRSIAAWIGRRANGADEPSPPVQEAPWWVR